MSDSTAPIPAFYRPELDGLRFLAFLAVLMHHAVPNQPITSPTTPAEVAQWDAALSRTAGFGTDLFFVLSSYLITALLLREQRAFQTLNVPRFYMRRILRIWPLYYVFVLLVLFVLPRYQPNTALAPGYEVAFLLFGANWACALWGFPHSPAGPLWSVSIEEQFYFVWPLVLNWARGRSLPYIAAGMLALSSLARVALALLDAPEGLTWFGTFTRLDAIACGLLASTAFEQGRSTWRAREWTLVAAGGFVLLVVLERYVPVRWKPLPAYPLAAFTSLAMLRAVLLVGERSMLARSPFTYLGKISYGLYVFHLLALSGATKLVPWASPQLYYPERMAVALGISIVLGTASFYVLERPLLQLKARFARVASRPV